jgi:hypothetical protein
MPGTHAALGKPLSRMFTIGGVQVRTPRQIVQRGAQPLPVAAWGG